MYRNIL